MNPGQPLEQYLDVIHANYRRQGKACVVKIPTPVQITNHITVQGVRNGRVSGFTLPVVWVDYSGVVAGGLGVAIEAKTMTCKIYSSRAKTRNPEAFPLSRLPQHQRAALRDVHALGGIAALYLRQIVHGKGMLPASSDYFVPAVYLETLDRKSIPWDDVERYKVPPGMTWLDSLRNQAAGEVYPSVLDGWEYYRCRGWESGGWR